MAGAVVVVSNELSRIRGPLFTETKIPCEENGKEINPM